MKTNKGFTLIELLVVISIIGLIASVVLVALNGAKTKARDTKRAADIDQIYKALNLYYNQYSCLPTPSLGASTTCGPAAGIYSNNDAGGWDYSSQGGFLNFLVTAGIMSKVPVDPLNNMTGDASPSGTYAYRYYCYPSNSGTPGLHLGYWTESTGGVGIGPEIIKNITNTGTWSDSTFICQ